MVLSVILRENREGPKDRGQPFNFIFSVISSQHKINNRAFAKVSVSFFFEISPHRDFGLPSGLKWPKFRATLGEHKIYFRRLSEALIF